MRQPTNRISTELLAQATDFYSEYTVDRLQVRAGHLLAAGKQLHSAQALFLAEAAFLALQWKRQLSTFGAENSIVIQ